ncbi:hypothetical protein GCM10023096_32520 [Nonomuraea ferruginea]
MLAVEKHVEASPDSPADPAAVWISGHQVVEYSFHRRVWGAEIEEHETNLAGCSGPERLAQGSAGGRSQVAAMSASLLLA